MPIAKVSLAHAARIIPAHPSSLRRALDHFGIRERNANGQREMDEPIAKLMRHSKQRSGYLYPRHINTREKLLAAALELA